MTTPDKLSDLHHRLNTLARKLSDCMSDLGGIARVLEGLGAAEACREGREPEGAGAEDAVDYGVYRGVVGAYAPVRLVGPTGDEIDEAYGTESRRRDDE